MASIDHGWPRRGDHNEWRHDLQQYDTDLRNDADRLFLPLEKGRVEILDVGSSPQIIRDTESLRQQLNEPAEKNLRIIMLQQKSSWTRITASEELARSVLSHMNAVPAMARTLSAFGQRSSESSEHIGSYASDYRIESNSTDNAAEPSSTESRSVGLCYLLKCVEKHEKEGFNNPWSIRQFAVCEQHLEASSESTFLLINPTASEPLTRRIAALRSHDLTPRNRIDVHTMFASSAVAKWRHYITWLEAKFEDLDTKASVDPMSVDEKLRQMSVQFSDTQALHNVQDKLQLVLHILKANSAIITALVKDLGRGNPNACLDPSTAFNNILMECNTQSQRVESLLSRTNALSNLLNNIISFKTLEALSKSGNDTSSILNLGRQDSKLMYHLAEKAGEDTKTLKTITILTLIYLPATFVATLLGMGYIEVHYVNHRPSIHFNSEMWIFMVLTIILLLITFGVWGYSERKWLGRKMRSLRKIVKEKSPV